MPMFKTPSETVMFTDAAWLHLAAGRIVYVEYSMVELPYFTMTPWSAGWNGLWGEPDTGSFWTPTPSIHFRHGGLTNVLWLDGRVTAKRMDWSRTGTVWEAGWADSRTVNFGDYDLGWFGPEDFTLFDYR